MGKAYVYTLEYPEGNIRYVGQSKDPKKRYYDHLRKSREGSKKVDWVQQVLREGHKPILKILEQVEDKSYEWETFYISLFRSWGFELTNRTSGGENGKQLDNSLINEFKESCSLRLKQNPHGPRYGEFHTQETKEKMRQIAFNRVDRRLDSSRPILQFDLKGCFIKEYKSTRDAVRSLNKRDVTVLRKCLDHEFHKAHGYIWIRKDEYIVNPNKIKEKVRLLETKYLRRKEVYGK